MEFEIEICREFERIVLTLLWNFVEFCGFCGFCGF